MFLSQWVDHLKIKIDRSRRGGPTPRSERSRTRLGFESLEDRRVLSAISWVNRGSDGFDDAFGGNAALARGVVDAVIDSWERVIEDFNYSDGTNTFRLTVNMAANGTGFGASAGPTATDPVTGAPTAGAMTVSRGLDGPDSNGDWVDVDGDGTVDPRGDGIGWFLDPTPMEHSEFMGDIVNAYVGNTQFGSPARGMTDLDGDGFINPLFDLFTPVAHELGHALGFLNTPQMTALSTRAPQTDRIDGPTGPDTDGDGVPDGPFASMWIFNGPSIKHVLTGYNASSPPGDFGAPAHSAPAGADATIVDSAGNTVTYNGATDLMTPFYMAHQRKLVSYTAALILKDAYGYTVNNPAEFGTFYATLNTTTRELTIRGGSGSSDDLIVVSQQGTNIHVNVNLGDDVPGTGPFPGDENLPGFESLFPRSRVDSIVIESGGGDDIILVDIPTFIDSTIRGGDDDDTIAVTGVGALAPTTIEGNAGNDTIRLGYGDFSGTAGTIRSDVVVRGGSGTDRVEIMSTSDPAPATSYTITSTQFREDSPGGRTVDLAAVEALEVYTGPGNDEVNVESTSFTLTIDSRAGADTFNIGGGDYDSNIHGTITLNDSDWQGPGGDDVLNILDELDSGDDRYTFTATGFLKSGASALTYTGVDRVVLHANSGSNSVRVDSLSSTTSLTLNGNGGNDQFHIGNGDYDSNIRGAVTVNGGGQDDSLTIDDTDDGGSGDRYLMNGSTFSKESSGLNVPVLTFSGVSDVSLDGSDQSSDFYVWGVNSAVSLTIDGNGAVDRFYVWGGGNQELGGDYDNYIRGPISINGGSGSNELFVDDRRDTGSDERYVLDRTTFRKEDTTVANVPALQFTNFGTIQIEGSDAPNFFEIESVASGVTVTASGNDGADTFQVGRRDFDTNIVGTVILRGGGGSDTLNIDDRGDLTEDDYAITANRFTKNTTAGSVEYSSISTFNFDANTKNNTISIHGAPGNLRVNAHQGNDRILVAPDHGNLDLIRGGLTITGGDGTDEVVLNDQNFLMNGLPGSLPYFIHPNMVQKILLPDPNIPYGKFPGLGYQQVEDLTLQAAHGDNPIIVHGTIAASLHLFGNGGLDTFVIASGDFDSSIRSPIEIHGGAGADTLNIDDRTDLGNDDYVLDENGFTKSGADGEVADAALLTFTSVASLVLLGSNDSNNFLVNATQADTRYELRGNEGPDHFLIQAAGLNSSLIVNGGQPDFSPGDTLRLVLTRETDPVLTVTSADAGEFVLNSSVTLSYSGMEGALATYPGDFNLDGVVDERDREIYMATFGTTASPPGSGADANRDGIVNAADGVLLRNYMGSQYHRAGASSLSGSPHEEAYTIAFYAAGSAKTTGRAEFAAGARQQFTDRTMDQSSSLARFRPDSRTSFAVPRRTPKGIDFVDAKSLDYVLQHAQFGFCPVAETLWETVASGGEETDPTRRLC